MRKQTFLPALLALGVAMYLVTSYAQAQSQGSNITPTAPPSGSVGATNPAVTNPRGSAANPNQPNSLDTGNPTPGTLNRAPDQAVKETDRNINSQIRQTLSRNSGLREASNSVGINTNNGVVTLNGTVASEKEKMDLETEIRHISGVSHVQNDLQIAP